MEKKFYWNRRIHRDQYFLGSKETIALLSFRATKSAVNDSGRNHQAPHPPRVFEPGGSGMARKRLSISRGLTMCLVSVL